MRRENIVLEPTDGRKLKTLRTNGSFNRHAASVTSPLFAGNPYFDPHDLVQVKYEMLRAVKNDGVSVTDAARWFGFSRVAYYKTQKRFDESGVEGLCLRKTGPKAPAKVTDDVLNFAADLKAERPGITNDELVREIQTQKGIELNKRSLQRGRAKKKHR
jgi:transposase